MRESGPSASQDYMQAVIPLCSITQQNIYNNKCLRNCSTASWGGGGGCRFGGPGLDEEMEKWRRGMENTAHAVSFWCSQVKHLARCHSWVCLVKSCSTEITWGSRTNVPDEPLRRTHRAERARQQQGSVLTTSGSNARSSASRRRSVDLMVVRQA